MKQALLVEPYFRLDHSVIAEFGNVVRVLVGSKLSRRDFDLLATGLASLPGGRSVEIRKAADLHDRYLIPAGDGHVVMLGASLGGIGKKVSTMTTLGAVASIALRDAHERLWRDAEVIEPKKPSASQTAEPPAEEADEERPEDPCDQEDDGQEVRGQEVISNAKERRIGIASLATRRSTTALATGPTSALRVAEGLRVIAGVDRPTQPPFRNIRTPTLTRLSGRCDAASSAG